MQLRYFSAGQASQSVTLTGEMSGGPVLERIAPSEVAQKLLTPVLLSTGVLTARYSLHGSCLQRAVTRKRYPDFVHQAFAVQLSLARLASSKPAWSADADLGLRGSIPSLVRSGA